ncbi:MAG: DNA-directed RNA polymerase subunit omega [Owenweeksia sp.]|nr:DNA-directed RNA polymerase subunit omega [Owenweeksia sp.]
MDYKKTQAPRTSQTMDHNKLDAQTGNIYEAIAIMSKRAEQIGEDLKLELHDKLEEFATPTESLEEIFENKEQIEVSRYYEALPKPHSIATAEWIKGKVYFRRPGDSQEKTEA